MDALDQKLNEHFDGRVLRKDLLHRIKKGTNVPTFVLEFLLAKYCASNDEAEMEAGMAAVLQSLQENYVRPDEANAAQSQVATQGRHRFIDKIHVRYVEKEKKHWASLENFNSQRIAISERFYRDNDRLLEGGIWAEVTVAHNDIETDSFAFYIEELRPIQLSRFDFGRYKEGRDTFTRDEWLDVILRSVGLEPTKLDRRVKMHFMARLAPLVEPNYNYIELGPRGTGKSYFFSEFSPYATLVSGGQASKATLFYNNARRKVGLVGFWDTVAFDEVGGIKVKDPETIQIMKDFMANGRFSRGVEVIADASLSFVGNIDLNINQVVHSTEYDLFQPLPEQLDLAIMDRFAAYIPGWEMPKNSTEYLTTRYGFITDYLAEAFHYQFKHTNRYEEVSKRIRLGSAVEGRDEKGIKKTVAALLKILHPSEPPTDEEFDEYVEVAVEYRRRVKEQMNKRKPDDEFEKIDLSYVNAQGVDTIVYCPESKDAVATQSPKRATLDGMTDEETTAVEPVSVDAGADEKAEVVALQTPADTPTPQGAPESLPADDVKIKVEDELAEKHFTIRYGDVGFGYESILLPYARGAKSVKVEDPYIRQNHQIQNLARFCEVMAKAGTIRKIDLITGYQHDADRIETDYKLGDLEESLKNHDIQLTIEFDNQKHDRQIVFDNGWTIKIGRGLDFYQKPQSFYELGSHDLELRPCLETMVDIFKA